MEIFFSVDNNKEILKIPYIPPGITFDFPLNSGTFETSSGTVLTLIGKPGLRNFTIESFFPIKLYRWLPNIILAPICIEFFKKNRNKVFRVVIVSINSIELNMLCTIKNFKYHEKQNMDVNYTLEVEEYIDPAGVRQ